nr:aminopeptidase [Variovorax terrae]
MRAAALLVLAGSLAGCANLGYYWQSVSGHLALMQAARPIDDWLADPAAPAALKARLELAQRIRAYAVAELKLPDNASYHRYADLHRRAAVWNVVAAPELSLTLHTWCFVAVGCVGYRGYYDEAEAQALARELQGQGLETSVYGVPAYSTLGWMNWLGGDPLLNTFIGYPEGELARLVFHELAHQVVYAKGDTMFNESFATAVERLGSQRWLATQAGEAARREYADYDARRTQFKTLTLATRRRLAAIYEPKPADVQAQRSMVAMKDVAMQDFRAQYAQLRAAWGGDPARYAGYDAWVARANNAAFGAQAAYDEQVPAFEALFQREGQDWQRFYDAVKRLAAMPKNERDRALKAYEETPGA